MEVEAAREELIVRSQPLLPPEGAVVVAPSV